MTVILTRGPLARALAERNYDKLTPVQTAVLADDAAGRDLLVSAQTGSGKTVAYGLAIANQILGEADQFGSAGAPLALIVAPTRELALQVHRELSWLYRHAGGRVLSCVGGMDPRREQRDLADGAHIVVGTPGRLCDHLRRGRLDVSQLKAVVLDEADEMLDMGFREDMEFILEATPQTRQTLLFSATFPRGIVALAKQFQRDAVRVEVSGDEGGHADIEYRAVRVHAGDLENAVVNVLRFFESPGALVFCNTRNAVRHLQAMLLERGFSVVALSGELTQNERTQALQSLRDGRARVCVATDVAARGIDLPSLDLVIHADLPTDPEILQHRSGRTGRAGRKGVAVLLVPPSRRRRTDILLSQAGIEAVWEAAPSAEQIRKLDQQRMLQEDLFKEFTDEDLSLARALLADRSAEDIAAALARLYRAGHPAPEDIVDPGEDSGRARHERGRERSGRDRREEISDGAVWFSASIGRQKNAEARWLLPMICRRGGIKKHEIGKIRILDVTTEFEISANAAASFEAKIRRPDKEDTIRIERLTGAPSAEPARGKRPQERDYGKKRPHKPTHKGKPRHDKPYHGDEARHKGKPKRDAHPQRDSARPGMSKRKARAGQR